MEPITENKYKDSVLALVKVALSDAGQSRFAAQVVLSAYNGANWQLDVTDLCGLDDDLYEHAINTMRGRVELRMEPHECVEDGDSVFLDIQRRHTYYHISNRWKKDCHVCEGRGLIYDDPDGINDRHHECKACKGSGYSNELPEAPNFG